MSDPPSRADRILGCLFAGALGDAIGAHFERNVTPSQFAMPDRLQVTDDTELTLATCQAIIDSESVNPASIAQHFLRWFRERRITNMGASTLKALTELDAGGHWALVGATGEYSSGNGAAMRIAPLAFVCDPDVDRDRQVIRDVCRITHRNDEAYIGALAILRLIRSVVDGHELDSDLLTRVVHTLPDSRVRDRVMAIRDSSLSVEEYVRRFAASGYVVDSVPLAILAAIRSADLLSGTREIAECGGDTDTIASMFGQIFGAAFGSRVLPTDLIEQIDAVGEVRDTANRFIHLADRIAL